MHNPAKPDTGCKNIPSLTEIHPEVFIGIVIPRGNKQSHTTKFAMKTCNEEKIYLKCYMWTLVFSGKPHTTTVWIVDFCTPLQLPLH